ncbi:hypothetical protein NB550_11750 [Vibrio parahaemolyticus]|uniref:hypothetical protein n=1 Tax=Vibrio parahaemolyticus TaxID=670 RepID=UPI0011108337|nr:hypothetical protein [Vibrio parahaemolyticus]EHU6487247.1 hypothetical protein [Vibrio parahaemolyticus]EIA9327167.1 hypothetical protein [Vibrio parahaemolyticus]EJG1681424.1 hypothetical protein [Vibrio parahaemolyticus]MBE4385137.1 hypothetical protein [Vibrio parahaemolyticus]MCR9887953.1 hypothetical protein [Vibrio parahaemolyticus]
MEAILNEQLMVLLASLTFGFVFLPWVVYTSSLCNKDGYEYIDMFSAPSSELNFTHSFTQTMKVTNSELVKSRLVLAWLFFSLSLIVGALSIYIWHEYAIQGNYYSITFYSVVYVTLVLFNCFWFSKLGKARSRLELFQPLDHDEYLSLIMFVSNSRYTEQLTTMVDNNPKDDLLLIDYHNLRYRERLLAESESKTHTNSDRKLKHLNLVKG